jgi:hypothetical protein
MLDLCDFTDSHGEELEALEAALRELWKRENQRPNAA